MSETTNSLRSHGPPKGRPIVRLTGDGTPKGTAIHFEGVEPPGPVVEVRVTLRAGEDRMAAGEVDYQKGDGTKGTLEVWVQFER